MAIAEEINTKLKANENAFSLSEGINDEAKKTITLASRFSNRVISPMAAFFGGITAQEVVKVTGKYTPVTQFFHFEQFLTLP